MSPFRTFLIVAAVVLFCLASFVGGTFGVPEAWEYPRDSLRHQTFEYFFVKHRWLTLVVYVAYLGFVLFEFRGELRSVFARPSVSRIAGRVLLVVAALFAYAYYKFH